MTDDSAPGHGPDKGSGQLVSGIAALYAAAADFDATRRFPAIPRGAASSLLEDLVLRDPRAVSARDLLESLRLAAGVARDHAGWPVDVLEADRALDQLLDRPDATSVGAVFGEREYPWEYLAGLAEDRIRRGVGDTNRLRRVIGLLLPLVGVAQEAG